MVRVLCLCAFFVTGKWKWDRPIVPFDDLHRITFWVDLCMSVRPSVRLSIQMKFCKNHLFVPRTNPIEIGDNRSKFRYSSHIYLRPICFLLCTKRAISARIVWNFAYTTKLGLKICMPNLIEIGSDIAIAPIYMFHPIWGLNTSHL